MPSFIRKCFSSISITFLCKKSISKKQDFFQYSLYVIEISLTVKRDYAILKTIDI